MTSPNWRLLVSAPSTGAENMALDEALMLHARATGNWIFRLYAWSEPTISFGRNQTARDRYDLDRLAARGLAVVRRPTGGRAILHDREITYSVTAPVEEAGDLRASYERINRLVVAGLENLGVYPTMAERRQRAAAPGMAPCFDEPSAGELVLNGRKLAGSAQWRSEGALLQHGSILIEDDQSLLAELASTPQRAIPRPATLLEALGERPTLERVATAFTEAVRTLEDPAASELKIDDELRAHTDGLVVRYLDDDWTWRR